MTAPAAAVPADQPAPALKALERGLLRAVKGQNIVRWYWPARVVEGEPMPEVSIDLDIRCLRSVQLRMERAERAGWVELGVERFGRTDPVCGGNYETSLWQLTTAGEIALRAGERS